MSFNINLALLDALRLEIVGSRLAAFQNGNLIGAFVDTDFSSGQAALSTYTVNSTDFGLGSIKLGNVITNLAPAIHGSTCLHRKFVSKR